MMGDDQERLFIIIPTDKEIVCKWFDLRSLYGINDDSMFLMQLLTTYSNKHIVYNSNNSPLANGAYIELLNKAVVINSTRGILLDALQKLPDGSPHNSQLRAHTNSPKHTSQPEIITQSATASKQDSDQSSPIDEFDPPFEDPAPEIKNEVDDSASLGCENINHAEPIATTRDCSVELTHLTDTLMAQYNTNLSQSLPANDDVQLPAIPITTHSVNPGLGDLHNSLQFKPTAVSTENWISAAQGNHMVQSKSQIQRPFVKRIRNVSNRGRPRYTPFQKPVRPVLIAPKPTSVPFVTPNYSPRPKWKIEDSPNRRDTTFEQVDFNGMKLDEEGKKSALLNSTVGFSKWVTHTPLPDLKYGTFLQKDEFKDIKCKIGKLSSAEGPKNETAENSLVCIDLDKSKLKGGLKDANPIYIPIDKKELYKCMECNIILKNSRCYSSHMVRHWEQKWGIECQQCGKVVESRCALDDHLKEHSLLVLLCSYCPERFTIKANLHHHEAIHLKHYHAMKEPNQEPAAAPPLTNKLNSKGRSVRPHIVCYICGKEVAKKHISTHILMHDLLSRQVECKFCGRGFQSEHRLNAHIQRMHKSVKSHVCEQCGKALTKKASLQKHMRIHTGEFPFQCSFCDKKFRCPYNRSQHENLHKPGIKKYECEVCSKRFFQLAALIQHRRQHTGFKVTEEYERVVAQRALELGSTAAITETACL